MPSKTYGRHDRVNRRLEPAPWPPGPTDADDDYCPVCHEVRTRAEFRSWKKRHGRARIVGDPSTAPPSWSPRVSWEEAVEVVRSAGSRQNRDGELSTTEPEPEPISWSRGPVLWAARVLSLNEWRYRHGFCISRSEDA